MLNMNFGSPEWFWALLLVPLGLLLFLRAERRSALRLRDFVSPRLLPVLAGKVDRRRRRLRFALQITGLALAIASLTQPRWGYTFEEAHRKGIDLLIAVDTSRSMLSNDVAPNRLERVKLAAQDLINQLQGDRVGLIAFAGRAFIQAPLTIDYSAVVEAINDLNTQTIPEGGTNISEAINLADKTYGKSATGNRALVIFTDGEELSGDAVKTAQAAAETGARIFTVGVGTAQGSLIPIQSDESQSAFVKDARGQVVKSKLDEHRLEEIAKAAHGFYIHLENGPRTMQQLATEGIGKIQAGDIDVRLSRRPIERYEWPLGLGVLCLAGSILVGERKRVRRRGTAPSAVPAAAAAGIVLIFSALSRAYAAAPGLNDYDVGNFTDAYAKFQETLRAHPQTSAADKLNFDSGAAAYKMKEYGKALEAFSQALLSPDQGLQSKSHYNLGNTLYERGENEKTDDKKLANWTNALQHYEQTLKIEPQNKEAKENYEFVKRKIDELKNKQPPPSPTPTPKQNKQDQQKKSDQKNQSQQQKQDQQKQQDQQQQQSSGGQGDQQQQQQQDQSQGNSGSEQEKKDQNKQGQSGDQKQNDAKDEPEKSNGTPSPTPGSQGPSPTPSPSAGEGKEQKKNDAGEQQTSPTPGDGQGSTPTPSPHGSPTPGAGEGGNGSASPSPAPSASPNKKFSGEIKGNGGDNQEKPPAEEQPAAEVEKEGEMTERQAQALLESMRNEEARVQLDERRAARRVYNDW